jgi:hypothetical protein
MRMRRWRSSFALAFFVFIALSVTEPISHAGESGRRVEEEKRKSLEETELRILKGEKRIVIDFGGWCDFRYDDYHDDDNDSSLPDAIDYINSIDTRVWMKVIMRPPPASASTNVHYLYVRLRDFFVESYPNDKTWKSVHGEPHLDYAYAVADFHPLWVQAGRQYVSVGQGIAYSDVNDAVQVFLSFSEWRFKALASRTLPHEDNIDQSVPGSSDGSDRFFYGFEASYRCLPCNNLYGYFVMQRDNSDEEPEDPAHDYTYDSEYIGVGTHGEIFPPFHYLAEIIRETGSSRIYQSNEKGDIDAWGGVFEVAYDWMVYSHPRFSVRYAFGTGDSERQSVTDTVNGNASGKDKNFLYFGYIPAGYALSPRLSNLHFIKGAISLMPFERFAPLKRCTVKVDYYHYYKDRAAGAIYDLDAIERKRYVGDEVDLEVFWQMLSDVSCTIQYGHFIPGDAYPRVAHASEDYFSVSVTLTF